MREICPWCDGDGRYPIDGMSEYDEEYHLSKNKICEVCGGKGYLIYPE